MPISSMMVGMETLTIELSSTIMAKPRAITHSAPHGGVWAGSGDEAVGFVEDVIVVEVFEVVEDVGDAST